MEKTPNQMIIKSDIMRYKKNKLASTFAILSLVFSCLYFCLLYSFRNQYFAKWEIGISVILTLFMLLLNFLASEGIKNYNKKFCILLIILAVVQIIRIFGLPLEALNYGKENNIKVFEGAYFDIDMPDSLSFTFLVLWLSASAACLVASAIIGFVNCQKLENHMSAVEKGEVDVDGILKEMDKENAALGGSPAQERADLIDEALKSFEAEEEAEEAAESLKQTEEEPEVEVQPTDEEV